MARARTTPGAVYRVRTVLAQVVWVVCSVAALFLALGVLLVAFKADTGNPLVKLVLDVADTLDLGVLDRDHGITQWSSADAETRNALVNWGLAAVVWLIAGRVLDRLIRPSEPATTR